MYVNCALIKKLMVAQEIAKLQCFSHHDQSLQSLQRVFELWSDKLASMSQLATSVCLSKKSIVSKNLSKHSQPGFISQCAIC